MFQVVKIFIIFVADITGKNNNLMLNYNDFSFLNNYMFHNGTVLLQNLHSFTQFWGMYQNDLTVIYNLTKLPHL